MRRQRWWLAGLAIAVLVVVVLAPLASTHPDGLERVATDLGFIDEAQGSPFGIFADYAVPGIGEGPLTTIVAGLGGVVMIFVATWVLGALLSRRRRAPGGDDS